MTGGFGKRAARLFSDFAVAPGAQNMSRPMRYLLRPALILAGIASVL
jgi:hypothetical protein